MSKIINFKLISGEEIIAKLDDEMEEKLVISDPRVLTFQDHGDGRVAASFVPPLVLGSDKEISVGKHAISMYTFNITAEYEKRYLESVSGIQLATSLKG